MANNTDILNHEDFNNDSRQIMSSLFNINSDNNNRLINHQNDNNNNNINNNILNYINANNIPNNIQRQYIIQILEYLTRVSPIQENANEYFAKDTIQEIKVSKCSICIENTCSIAFIPCGHVSTCSSCCKKITECPICRTKITRKQQLFFS